MIQPSAGENISKLMFLSLPTITNLFAFFTKVNDPEKKKRKLCFVLKQVLFWRKKS
jgi:hypothetical protein